MPKVIKHWEGKLLDVDEWAKAGKPEMWVIYDTYKDYKLYQDAAFGSLALTGPSGGVIDKGKDFVANRDNTVVGLGQYYNLEHPALFVRTDRIISEK